jgi:hypothetical protein
MFPMRYGETYRSCLRWIMSIIVIVILIYHRHKPTDSINLLDSCGDVLFTTDNVQNCDSYINIPSSQTYR